ncbi:hypothetical protein FJ366_02685 [Candidatus Dependentiae bacterium]|nr:hypothetical protein [Candidatus Dependentiae bacterium]
MKRSLILSFLAVFAVVSPVQVETKRGGFRTAEFAQKSSLGAKERQARERVRGKILKALSAEKFGFLKSEQDQGLPADQSALKYLKNDRHQQVKKMRRAPRYQLKKARIALSKKRS